MKAVVCDRYGPPEVLRLDDVERPVPRPDQVLIKIRATTVNRSDTETRQGSETCFALTQPILLSAPTAKRLKK